MLTVTDKVLSDEAHSGITALATGSAVFLAWQEQPSRYASAVGSGVVLKTPQGRPFVLSAAHVVNEFVQHQGRLGWFGLQSAVRTAGHAFEHPDSMVDVGILLPDRELATRLATLALDFTCLAPEPFETQALDLYEIVGFPGETVQSARNEQGFHSLTWPVTRESLPKLRSDGRLTMPWVPHGSVMQGKRGDHGLSSAAPTTPHGMSGGPLWRPRRARRSALVAA